jgi:thioredoxin-related protein
MRYLLLALSLSIIVPNLAIAADSTWITGWKNAAAQASAAQRPILADFTGSDWCAWCNKLKHEVFDTPEFAAWAKNSVVLMEVDFPQNRPVSDEQKKENQGLAERYQVDGFPTVLLLASNGTEIGRLGYQDGGPKAWIAAAEAIIAKAPPAK